MTKQLRLRVCWSGRNPGRGEWLESETGKRVFRIEHVEELHRAEYSTKPRLSLEVTRHSRQELPEGAVLHRWSRTEPVETVPDKVRQEGGHDAVMRDHRDDPEDASKRVSGWRVACSIRDLAGLKKPVTARHIAAADVLREIFDIARLGFSPEDDVRASTPGPRMGFSEAAQAQSAAEADLAWLLAKMSVRERAIVWVMVIQNITVAELLDGLEKIVRFSISEKFAQATSEKKTDAA